MNSTLSKVIIFTMGAAIGSAVTWKLLRTKYEKLAQDEIDEMREYYEKKVAKVEEHFEPETKEDLDESTDEELEDYKSEVEKLGYTNYASMSKEEKGGSNVAEKKIYIITPDEFSESEYTAESLVYYADDILVDDWGDVIEDPELVVGPDALSSFGQYEEDTVYVRNDDEEIDYEILRDVRKYSDVRKNEDSEQVTDE